MDWLILALTAAALWAGVSVVDKVIVEKHITVPVIYSFFMSTYGLVSAVLVWILVEIHTSPVGATLLAFGSGVLYLAYIVLYFTSLTQNDASVVVALGELTPIFAALWGFLFLGEVFRPATYVGVLTVVVGSVLLSLEKNEERNTTTKIRLNVAFQLMGVACFIRSISDLMLKYALRDIGTWDGFFWPRLGIFAGALFLLTFAPIRQRLWMTIKNIGWRVNLLIMGSEATALGGTFAITLAYALGPLTLVSATRSTQPLFVMLLVWVVNSIRQGVVPDRADRRLWVLRLLPMIMIVGGVYLLGR